MEVSSISYSTLLYQLSFISKIEDRDYYKVISTPTNPKYHWGNFLLFKDSPTTDDHHKWQSLFKKEFASIAVEHMAFAWDSPIGEKGEIDGFLDDGFYFEYDDILTSTQVKLPPRINKEISIRPLHSDSDWRESAELNLLCAEHDQKLRDRPSVVTLMDDFRYLAKKCKGAWMGAFIDDRLIGDMGIYEGGRSIGLISMVKTHPAFRERYVCSTLLYQTAMKAFEDFGYKKLVLVADTTGIAGKIYKKVGFAVEENGASLIRYNI